MKKKLAAGILATALLVAGASFALGAPDQSKLSDIKALYQQIFSLQKQIIQKEVDAGVITQDQATYSQNLLDQRQKYQEQAIDNGTFSGPGIMGGFGDVYGMMGGSGSGYGMMSGFGGGYGYGMMGGYGPGYGAAGSGTGTDSNVGPGYGMMGGYWGAKN